MKEPSKLRARKPWLAAVLSLFCTGLGHIYCGQFIKGLLLFTISLSYAPITFSAAWLGGAPSVLFVLFLSYLAVMMVCLYAAIDSYLLARRLSGDYPMRDYNHGLVYGLFILLGLLCPVAVAAQIKANAFEAFHCPAASMEPTLAKGDYFLVNKSAYRDTTPQRGDVVVFRNPEDRQIRFIKRLVGLPGDRVSVVGNKVHVNGRELPQEAADEEVVQRHAGATECPVLFETNGPQRYLIMLDARGPQAEDYAETEVPPGHCFVLGDSRDCSRDSRHFGFVPLADVLGRAQYIYFPARSWARLGKI